MKTYSLAMVNFIESLLRESEVMLLRHGETRLVAEKLSCGFVIELSKKVGGQSQYIGKNALLDAQSNRANIREDFKAGCTVNQLAEKYRLTTVRIYQIIGTRKENQIAKADMTLSAHVAITVTRMFMKTGITSEDSSIAARGLLAVIATKFAGMSIYIPKPSVAKTIIKNIHITRLYKNGKGIDALSKDFDLSGEDVKAIIDNHPRQPPEVVNSRLSLLKKRILNVADEFRAISPETCRTLETVAESIEQTHKIREAQEAH